MVSNNEHQANKLKADSCLKLGVSSETVQFCNGTPSESLGAELWAASQYQSDGSCFSEN